MIGERYLKNKLIKLRVPKSGSAQEQDLLDKMVLLIKEEIHYFYQWFKLWMSTTFNIKALTMTLREKFTSLCKVTCCNGRQAHCWGLY
jgi:tRNA isopentenyl-2-thiomethyl-A-37 hydroxylase MiaE